MKKFVKALAVVSALALSFNFVACKDEDDEENSIVGAQLTIDNTDGTSVKRAYKSTNLKHLGSLTKIQLQDQSTTSDTGVIGLIWDLKRSDKAKDGSDADTDELTDKLDDEGNVVSGDARNFLILGFRNEKGTLKYYISKYYNVTNCNEYNFGAGDADANSGQGSTEGYTVMTDAEGLDATQPRELEVRGFTSLKTLTSSDISDRTITVWADVYPAQVSGWFGTKYGVKCGTVSEDEAPLGSYVVDIYVGTDTPTEDSTPVRTIITTTQTGYTAKPKQAKVARYGNAYAGQIMKGYVEYDKTYAEAEVVEDAE